MENKTVGIIIGAAVVLILGIVLVSIIAEQSNNATSTTVYTQSLTIPRNDTANGVNSSVKFHLTHGCPYATNDFRGEIGCELTILSVKNVSGVALTDPTDYVGYANGAVCSGNVSGDLIFKNSTNLVAQLSNATTITYSTCAEDYVAQSWGRTMLNMVPGFFAMAILIGAAFLIFKITKTEGIDLEV